MGAAASSDECWLKNKKAKEISVAFRSCGSIDLWDEEAQAQFEAAATDGKISEKQYTEALNVRFRAGVLTLVQYKIIACQLKQLQMGSYAVGDPEELAARRAEFARMKAARLAREEAARQAAEEARLAKEAAEKAEQERLAAEEVERQREAAQEAREAERDRLAREEAERRRLHGKFEDAVFWEERVLAAEPYPLASLAGTTMPRLVAGEWGTYEIPLPIQRRETSQHRIAQRRVRTEARRERRELIAESEMALYEKRELQAKRAVAAEAAEAAEAEAAEAEAALMPRRGSARRGSASTGQLPRPNALAPLRTDM